MIRNYINIIMGILYAFIGGFVIARNWFLMDLSPIAAISLGVLFIAYGIFRVYRAIKAIRSNED
ncbi:C4-dicarboxylate ABC transporter [Moheibacter lacus]|uniref:C4-dicarboxylate ABC transporter n=1 Tax=Moheibacter lacus TaxID=2745851 RepID=A0A838ZU92_9FLAO|nr:C4-dicarboxylate ABC transporter [Moheibacter lacus]MBA5630566.1 C4-dicarboxylate ABC transporter [Moheibacter lacus]